MTLLLIKRENCIKLQSVAEIVTETGKWQAAEEGAGQGRVRRQECILLPPINWNSIRAAAATKLNTTTNET